MEADFPYARTLIVVRNCRTVKKTNQTTTEPHYYLSSTPPDHYEPSEWLKLIRGHWAGVEIRNHWRRDVLLGEDGSRSRNANLLANLAILRNALLSVLADHFAHQPLPEIREQLNSCSNQTLRLLSS
jgi:predicted transposase YbfD/YdcC